MPRTMVKPAPEQDISAVQLGHGNVNDWIQRERVKVIGGARRLRQPQRGLSQRQVRPDEVRAQPQVFIYVASHTSGSRNASTPHEFLGRAAVRVGADAGAEVPVLVVVRPRFAPRCGFFISWLLAAGG